MQEKQVYWIDTDIGDDIDDALALALAMHQGMEIVGISTVFRNAEDRARLAKKLLCAFGGAYKHIPVLVGHALPMGKKTVSPSVDFLTREEKEDERLRPEESRPENTVARIIDACHTYGKRLTVVAMGPLTNLAHVIARDPTALPSVGRVAMMGGAFFRQYADWNVSCDPQAADVVFSHLPQITCVGADVTHAAVATPRFAQSLFSPAPTAPAWQCLLSDLAHRWLTTRAKEELVLHDPLLIASLLDDTLLSFTDAAVAVVTDGPAMGLTLNVDAYGKQWMNDHYTSLPPLPRHRLACACDLPRFLSLMEAMMAHR
jgi:purine nucleosidase/pyrimidine-specific ribonucleoside hydrolase